MSNRPAVTKARMKRAVAALEAAGKTVTGMHLQPDGSLTILTGAADIPASTNPLDAELAEWASRHGYDQP